MTAEQETAVAELGAALEAFGVALGSCLQVGLQPADALRAAGIDVPLFAGPMVDRALASMLTPDPCPDCGFTGPYDGHVCEETSAEGLHS